MISTEDDAPPPPPHPECDVIVAGDVEGDCAASPHSSAVYDALAVRLTALDQGIGKRYLCRTQKGWLNVHQEPGDPYNTHNVIGQLRQGQVVTSIGPPRGAWIRHDGGGGDDDGETGGGWSISIFGGFTWLEELQD